MKYLSGSGNVYIHLQYYAYKKASTKRMYKKFCNQIVTQYEDIEGKFLEEPW